jgi:phosphohistidine phosphatase
MKRITLFRHGKSSWDHHGLSDVDRPLLARGERRTRLVAEHLAEQGLMPDLIVTSHAVRALRTAAIAAEVLKVPPPALLVEQHLYHASPEAIWDVIAGLPEEYHHVILFGHNPGFTDFVNSNGIASVNWLPTSGVASAIFPCRMWNECPGTLPQNPFVVFPRNL